jgi:hypothetical protein
VQSRTVGTHLSMWLSEKLTALLDLNVQEVKQLRQDLAATRSERDALKLQAAVAQNNFEWARTRLNTLEMEKAALLAKAFNVNIPAPEIVRTARDLTNSAFQLNDLFAGPPLSVYDEVDEVS